jgi:molecular chaperone DnaJ
MAPKRDYYEILGISRDADGAAVKSAYRKLAVKFHPDRNPGDAEAEERFKEAAEAYAVLSDAEKRARYDRFGHEGVRGAGASPFGGGFDPTVFGDFADILGDLFGFGFAGGRRRGGRAATRGADLRYDLEVSFEEAAFGTERTLTVPRLERCPECAGSGSAGDEAPAACDVCGGRGQVRYNQGFLTVARTCPKCQGEGTVVKDPCPECRGQGLVERERKIEVKIPAGVDTGARLRLQGEGEHGRFGGPAGDLYVVTRVAPHETFRREGPHVLSEVEVSYPQAVLGASIEIPTLHGSDTVEVPPGTEPGQQFRLRGQGIPHLDGRGRGDHVAFARLHIPRPGDLTEEQVELLRQLAEAEGKPVREGVLERMKKMFH